MKSVRIALLIAAIGMLFAVPRRSFAQTAADTMYVPPLNAQGQPDLFEIISGDTTSTGLRKDPNRVYVLYEDGPVDTVYYLDNTITMNQFYNLNIVGEINPVTGHPPVIEPIVNADNTTPDPFIACDTGNVSLDGVYLLGERPDSVAITSTLISSTGNYTTIRLNHCIVDNFYGGNTNLTYHEGVYDNLYVTNCEFRNVQSYMWAKGALYWEMTKGPVDTLWYENNTFFSVNGSYFGSNWYAEYIRFDHNTCFLGSGPPMKVQQAVNEDIENNIFYGLIAHAGDMTQDTTNQFGGKVDYPNIVVLDTLGALTQPPFNLTEADRHVNVMNNVYCWPSALVNFWTSYNDTTHDPLTPPVFMDSTTQYLFAHEPGGSHLVAANNDSVNPGFSSTLTTPALADLVKYEELIWSNNDASDYFWTQLPTYPGNLFAGVPKNWAQTQGYPVPENLTYSDKALLTAGTDGKPLGDLNWYPTATPVYQIHSDVPNRFALSQNYPNPFNPTTEIKVTLNRPGTMSLKVYNVLGELVDVVSEGYKAAGAYTFNVNMDRFASGVYFYTLREGSSSITRKMLLLK